MLQINSSLIHFHCSTRSFAYKILEWSATDGLSNMRYRVIKATNKKLFTHLPVTYTETSIQASVAHIKKAEEKPTEGTPSVNSIHFSRRCREPRTVLSNSLSIKYILILRKARQHVIILTLGRQEYDHCSHWRDRSDRTNKYESINNVHMYMYAIMRIGGTNIDWH